MVKAVGVGGKVMIKGAVVGFLFCKIILIKFRIN
jgi:hypothetical protein